MDYVNTCVVGRPAGGRVREDDPKRDDAAKHDARSISPGLARFLAQVVNASPMPNDPPRPIAFPPDPKVEHYPGHSAADVHFEGRAADIFFAYDNLDERLNGDWLFDWCVKNCTVYSIQGVIFGPREWFSEHYKFKDAVHPRAARDHYDHVHVELNCDGANLIPANP